jgi:hypothetical protein
VSQPPRPGSRIPQFSQLFPFRSVSPTPSFIA